MKQLLDFSKINNYLQKDVRDIFKARDGITKKTIKKKVNPLIVALLIAFFFSGVFGGLVFQDFLQENLGGWLQEIKTSLGIPDSVTQNQFVQLPSQGEQYSAQTSQERAVINAVKKASPGVVSIVIFKEVPIYEEYYTNPLEDMFGGGLFQIQIPQYRQNGTEMKQVGGGTGFIVSNDGLIITNKHVVSEAGASFVVVDNSGKKYSTKVLAKDPFQDLALLKIDKQIGKESVPLEKFPILKLGDSSGLEIGQTVIAIGNALGEFNNTVSVGVISGLSRKITASDGVVDETLEDIIQTDAAINKGNSGGPLLNLKGEVIGVNVAIAEGAQSIGFSVPINKAKRDIVQFRKIGKITYAFLGVRYILITPEIQEEKKLALDYGVLLVSGNTASEPAVQPGSSGAKAGLKEGDIILKVDDEKITGQNSLAEIIQQKLPGDKIVLDVLRGVKNLKIEAVLSEKTS